MTVRSYDDVGGLLESVSTYAVYLQALRCLSSRRGPRSNRSSKKVMKVLRSYIARALPTNHCLFMTVIEVNHVTMDFRLGELYSAK